MAAAMLFLSGAEDMESLDEQEVERYECLASHPVAINLSSRVKLLSSGLFSPYQAASLLDYRKTHGDILSIAELSMVDGFGAEYAGALAPFVSFASPSLPGQGAGDSVEVRQTVLARTSVKVVPDQLAGSSQGNASVSYGVKYRLDAGELAEFSLAAKSAYSDASCFPPSSWTSSMAFFGRRRVGKVIAGDFNARFGQGLALWSGLSMSGFSGSASFCRRPTGLSPAWSYSGTGSHRGVAADFIQGRFVLSTFASFPGLKDWCERGKSPEVAVMPGANLAWYGRNGQVSATAWWLSERMVPGNLEGLSYQSGGMASLDGRWSWKGISLAGEFSMDCFNVLPAAVGSASVPLSSLFGSGAGWCSGWRFLAVGRQYSQGYCSVFSSGVRAWSKTEDERGIALGLEKRRLAFTLDYSSKPSETSTRQLKFLAKIPFQVTGRSVLSLRVSERFRPYEPVLVHRAGLRCDLDYSSAGISAVYGDGTGDCWRGRVRLEGLHSRDFSGLCYAEAGRKEERWSCYLRGMLFRVDSWDDRIYVYERDAPGNFTVPACYGRGCSASAVASAKFFLGRAGKFGPVLKTHLRASLVSYPFMPMPKPTVTEFKFQATLDI
jgi:hypothetical protein